MYASIQRYEHVTGETDDLIPARRRCATALGQLPGFVAYVLLAAEGQLVAISPFEDQADLLAAAAVTPLGQGLGAASIPQAAGQPCNRSGEVLVQQGL
jgi:hypothetical protein